MTTPLETVRELKQAAVCGSLGSASKETLNSYAAALCSPNAFGEFNVLEFPQICETVRIHLLRSHIESLQDHVVGLHTHITDLSKSNARIQWWVIALASASLIAAVVQTTAAIRSERRVAPMTQSNMPPQLQSAPSLAGPVPAEPSLPVKP